MRRQTGFHYHADHLGRCLHVYFAREDTRVVCRIRDGEHVSRGNVTVRPGLSESDLRSISLDRAIRRYEDRLAILRRERYTDILEGWMDTVKVLRLKYTVLEGERALVTRTIPVTRELKRGLPMKRVILNVNYVVETDEEIDLAKRLLVQEIEGLVANKQLHEFVIVVKDSSSA